MIEKVVLDYLNDNLTNVSAYMEEPLTAPESYVVLQKTGSFVDDYLYHATFAVQSYGPSMYDAALLNETVKELMDGLVSLDVISKSKLNSDYIFTDTQKKKYRYQCVYDISYYKGE